MLLLFYPKKTKKMKQTFYLCMLFILTFFGTEIHAQTFSTYGNNLSNPFGLEFDANGNLWVAEVGTGNDDGKISVIEPNGTTHEVITGLPSLATSSPLGIAGAWRTYAMSNNRLVVVSGEGTHQYASTLLTYDLTGFIFGDPPKALEDFESATNIGDYVIGTLGFASSNPFSVATNSSGNLFITDMAANVLLELDMATSTLDTLVSFPPYSFFTFTGPVNYDAAPAKVISDGADGFYVSLFTGTPYPGFGTRVVHVSADGTLSDYVGGFSPLSTVVDIAIDPNDGALVALQYGVYDESGDTITDNSAWLVKVNVDTFLINLANEFGNATGLAFDATGDVYVSSFTTGEVLKIGFSTPSNDALCDAIELVVGDGCNGIPNINTDLATAEMNEPNFNCPGSQADTTVINSVWYSFVAPANDVHILATSDDVEISNSPYQINLFSLNGDCTDLSNLSFEGCDIPVTNIQTGASLITSGLTAGETYFIQISGRVFPDPASVLFSSTGCLTISEIMPLPNDDACNAIELLVDAPAQIFSNIGATAEVGEIGISPPAAANAFAIDIEGWAPTTNFIDNSVWFTFTTPPEGGHIQIDLFGTIGLSGNFNTQVAVYEVVDCGDFSTYTYVTSGDNGFPAPPPGSFSSALSVSPRVDLLCTEGDKTYAVVVDGGNSFFFQPIRNQGLFSIEVKLIDSPNAASISTLDATTICAGDGEDDFVNVTVEGGNGENEAWAITDTFGIILDLPAGPPFNFEGVGEGVCVIWHIFYDEITGLEIGGFAGDVDGCFDVSDSIRITRLTGSDCDVLPTNDDLCGAIPLSIDGSCNGTPNINIEFASAEINEPSIGCNLAGDTIVKNSVWFSFVAPANEVFILAAPDEFDEQLTYQMNLFSLNGDCADLSNLELVECGGATAGLLAAPTIFTNLIEGETYYVQVSGFEFFGNLFQGSGCLTITEITGTPANDDVCDAINLEVDGGAQIFNNIGSTTETDENLITPPAAAFPFANEDDGWSLGTNILDNSVWFTFTTTPDGGHIQIDLTGSIGLPGNFNAQLAVYESNDCTDFSAFNLVAATDNSLPDPFPGIVNPFPKLNLLCTEGNKTYHLLVDGGDSFLFNPTANQGLFSIEISLIGTPTASTISTTDATTVCTDDGIDDFISVESTGGSGENVAWVITDDALNILDLPAGPPFNFEGTPAGTCLIWEVNFDELAGAEIGENAADLLGCYELSNSIEVTRLTGGDCPLPAPDVELSITADKLIYGIYEHIVYNITATNNGVVDATGLTVGAGLPNGTVFGGHTATVGDYNLLNQTWDIGSLATGASAELMMTVFTLTEGSDLTNYVQVMSMNENDSDSTPGNGTNPTPNEDDEAAVTVSPNSNGGVVKGNGNIDLELSIETGNPTFINFEKMIITYSLTNNGPDAATGIEVNTPVPNNSVFITQTVADNGFDGEFNAWFKKWKIDALASGETATITVEIYILSGQDPLTVYAQVFLANENDSDSTPGNGTNPIPNEDDEAAISINNLNLTLLGNGNTQLSKEDHSEKVSEEKLTLYPNPASDEITIIHQSKIDYSTNYQIVSIDGKVIRQQSVDVNNGFNKLEWDINSLENGIYFIRIIGDDNEVVNLRFTKIEE